jgi:ribosomal protein RSM22 (predicted rRNA methylase)
LISDGAEILAPCPHHLACPIAAPDWCHVSVRLPRSRDHLLTKEAQVPFEDEPYAYLLAGRPGVGTRAAARVLSPPRATKPGIDLRLCTRSGVERRTVLRRDKAAYATARRLRWGDAAE